MGTPPAPGLDGLLLCCIIGLFSLIIRQKVSSPYEPRTDIVHLQTMPLCHQSKADTQAHCAEVSAD